MMNGFSNFGFLDSLIRTLNSLGIRKPTEIQNNTIPMIMSGQAVVGVSETGSGKTLAYALPLLHLLKTLENEGQAITAESAPRAIVMVPTRELGEQVAKVFKLFTHDTRVRVRSALGGMAMDHARRNISGSFEVLLATPGRLIQLMDQNQIDLTDVRVLVFDEADQMMDQGFLEHSTQIHEACPKDVHLALFSATVSPTVQDLINRLFSDAEVIRSSGSGKVVKTLTTQNRIVKDGERWVQLERILAQKIEGGTILFTNTREQCDQLAKQMKEKGFVIAVYRGEMEKSDRRSHLKSFASGQVKYLVATDLAGRGLDIQNVDRVINFHLPRQLENYLHRVGRTARAGRKGLVVNLVTERDEFLIAKLEGRKITKIDSAKYNSHPKVAEKAAAGKKTVHSKKAAPVAGKKSVPSKNNLSSKKPLKKKLEFQKPTPEWKPKRSSHYAQK